MNPTAMDPMSYSQLLKCPQTGRAIEVDTPGGVARVDGSDLTYPIIDGIIDFCPDSKDSRAAPYDEIAKRYDSFNSPKSRWTRLYNRIVWGRTDRNGYVSRIRSFLPKDCTGVIADVPVGTGVRSWELYSSYPNASIIACDLSWQMLRKAKEQFERKGMNRVILLRADAENLPIRDGVVDLFFSMNGIHAFHRKEKAIEEIQRSLRSGGRLIACFYVRGVRWLSDYLVDIVYSKQGTFVPPFLRLNDLSIQFAKMRIERQGNQSSIVYFTAIRD